MTGLTMRRLPTALSAALFLAVLPSVSSAQVRRVGHTATLLATGDVLIAGGVNQTGTTQTTCDLATASTGIGVSATGAFTLRRSSHTATLMSNGCVLAAGGNAAASDVVAPVPTATYEIYDPSLGTWNPVGSMATARYNHTATLLNNGDVMVCGGQDAAGNAILSCEFYRPTGCTTGSWVIHPSVNMLQARYNHTALLMKDGKVWFAGGANPAIVATGGYLTTTERYNPASDAFQSAAPMIEARSQHTATLMGDGKALVVGGYNKRDVIANKGVTESSEIYDPISNSVTPAAQMSARRHAHSAVLSANGSVEIYGGLGNITTTYVNPTAPMLAGSVITFAAPVTVPTATISGGAASIPLDYLLSKPVVGVIQDGEMWLSSPTVKTTWGAIDFVPASETVPGTGIRINLAGMTVGCNANGICGNIKTGVGAAAALSQMQGSAVFYRRSGVGATNSPIAAPATTVNLVGAINSGALNTTLNPGSSSLSATVRIDMGQAFVGKQITGGYLNITGGSIVQISSFAVAMSSGGGPILGSPTVAANGSATFPITFTGLEGTVEFLGDVSQSFGPGAVTVPQSGANADLTLTMSMAYTMSGADLSNEQFRVDIATVVIRKMVFADRETYNPKTNAWALEPLPGNIVTNQRYGHSATLLQNNDSIYYGGRACVGGAGCATQVASPSPGIELLYSEKNFANPQGQAAQKRAFHTSTLLPGGDILVAGGTNGPSILNNAEIFSTSSQTFLPITGSMRYVRDLHTASLLPNGRVLIAGGFTTNAASTGSTNTTEIYYPDTRLFIETKPMISSRSNHTAITLPDGNIFVAGGFGPGDVITGTSEIYISTQGRWVPGPTMPGGCERAIAAGVQLKNGRILLIGGINATGPLSTSARYDPVLNTWNCGATAAIGNATSAGVTAMHSHTATLLFDGRVLVTGGNDGLGELNRSFIYDPTGNTWSVTDLLPLAEPRFSHTATLLPNGNVTISGGSQRFGSVPTTVETYHVNGSSWVVGVVPVRFNAGPRAFHTMTLGLDNKLYAIGGSDGVIGGNGVTLYNTAESGYFTATPDNFTKNAPPSFRQSVITSAVNSSSPTQPILIGGSLKIDGSQFRGGTEASGGGAASANSSFSYPHIVLQQVDGSGGSASQSNGGFVSDLTAAIFANPANLATMDTSLTVALPLTTNGLPNGWYVARTAANDVFSNGTMIQAGPPKPVTGPTGVTGVALGTSSMQWGWTAIGGVDGYNVYNSTTGIFITTIPATGAPQFIQTNLDPSATTSILIAGYSLSGDGPLTASPTSYTLSTTPINVTIASVTFNDLLLFWGTNGNSYPGTIYEVTQSSDNFVTDVSTPVPQIFNQSNPFTTINNLTANTTYFFRVRAFNLIGLPSPYSVVVSTRTRAPVTQPVVSALTTTSIDWGWADPGGVTNYRVYNATNGVLLGTPALNSFLEIGLGTNTIHSIVVSAVTNAGEGPLSPPATAYSAAASPGLFAPPSVPTTGSLVINWTNNGNPLGTNYRVALTEFATDGSTLATITISTPGFSQGFGPLKPSTQYRHDLVAVNGDGIDSDTPPVVYGSTWTLPTAPTPLSALGTTPTTISVGWSTNNNSSSATYEVTYSTDNFAFDISTAVPFALNYGGTTATIPGLVTGSTYSVRVIARNPFGRLSQFSNSITTRTFNGGCAVGSICGPLLAAQDSTLFGTVGTPLRNILLRVPAHAFPSDVNVTVSTWSLADHVGGANCSAGAADYSFEIVAAPSLQPTKSLYLSFSFLPGDLGTIPASRALLMRYDPTSGTCVPLETSVNTATGEMIARINHFSLFQLGSVPLTNTAETARVFPNPYYAARDGFVTIDNVPPGARVRIFTLRGEQVLDVLANSSGLLTWSANNGAGRSVASGVYLVMVESGSTKKILKLAVIR